MPRIRAFVALGLALSLAWLLPAPAAAEQSIGLTGGVAIPGGQDLKLRQSGPGGEVVEEQEDVSVSAGPFVGATATYWGAGHPNLGLQLDLAYWRVSARTAPGPAGEFTVDQDRTALFLSVVGRVELSTERGIFLYGGLGAGPVLTDVSRGESEVGPAVGLLAGIAIRLTERLRLRAEARYLVTGDVDAKPGNGVRVETSGHGGDPIFGPHQDTRFFPLLIGLDWLF